MAHSVKRHHDISCGHRVHGHESKCKHLHGHNYRIHFTCVADALDPLGRVIDFTAVKERLCMWIEEFWDHKFLAWDQDTVMKAAFNSMGNLAVDGGEERLFCESIVWLPFNPTAENMAQHLVEVVGPAQLQGTGITLIQVAIDETAKCTASYRKEGYHG